jgi:hypothetical protein
MRDLEVWGSWFPRVGIEFELVPQIVGHALIRNIDMILARPQTAPAFPRSAPTLRLFHDGRFYSRGANRPLAWPLWRFLGWGASGGWGLRGSGFSESGPTMGAARLIEPFSRIVIGAEISNVGFVTGLTLAGRGLGRSAVRAAKHHAGHGMLPPEPPASPSLNSSAAYAFSTIAWGMCSRWTCGREPWT